MSKIPLKDRKAIKEAVPLAEAEVKKAGDALGITLTLVENTGDLYEALGDKGPSLAESYPKYFAQLVQTCTEFAKNATRKEAIIGKFNAVGGKVTIKIIDSSASDAYYNFSSDALLIEVKASYWGSWMSYYNAEYMEKVITVDFQGVEVPLIAKRNVNEFIPQIEAELKKASAVYGHELTWQIEKLGAVAAWLKADNRSIDDFGAKVFDYVKQFVTTFSNFVKNADNKEAVEDAFKTNQVGFKTVSSSESDVYFLWEDGSLLLQVKSSYWGSWLSYYKEEYLEKTL